jgi:hypothetical protein
MRGGALRVVLAVAVGLSLGAGVTAAIVWAVDDEEPPVDPVTEHEEAAGAFLMAWHRSRTGTFVVRSDFHRETARGGELDSEVLLVQRPPDYLLHQFGGVEGRLDDRAVGCSPDPDGRTVCEPTGDELETSYDDKVADEVATFVSYFAADDHPLYRVRRTEPGCFDLTLTGLRPSPPYGDKARFCFDDATGALTYVRIERPEGTDVTEVVDIRTDVRDSDFQLTE